MNDSRTPIDPIIKDGWFTNPSFHDGYILGLELLSKKMASIKLSTVKGDQYEVVLDGMTHLMVNNFRQGNIISDINVLTGMRNYEKYLKNFVYYRPKDLSAGWFTSIIDDLTNGTKNLILINPSYGCELTAICENIKLFKSVPTVPVHDVVKQPSTPAPKLPEQARLGSARSRPPQ